jgi:hypothetical protein
MCKLQLILNSKCYAINLPVYMACRNQHHHAAVYRRIADPCVRVGVDREAAPAICDRPLNGGGTGWFCRWCREFV